MTQRATLVSGTLLPLNNLLADGVYTAPFKLGSEECEVNLIIDSGSSTMAVLHRRYQPEQDMSLKPTALAQEICYGQGGWLGSVIHTQVQAAQLKLTDTPLALVHKETRHTFLEADGIWGLAYHPLNRSYDLSHYLALQHQRQKYTFPWPFGDQAQVLDQRQLQHFKTLISQAPEQDIPSCFTLMEQHGLCANRFALLCHRSSIHHACAETRQASLKDDSLNQGILILGGGEEQTHLYDGQFIDIKVVHEPLL
ncbi:pepsin-like aspartyl protease [Shewanella algae]|uniref:pepsin-like aspartyl protease n=1 Tax=Shewanella algae TaxID=38313 RepID=UPI001FBBB0A0|nr:pepsin-like aspartyl protease [Shewanella algae]